MSVAVRLIHKVVSIEHLVLLSHCLHCGCGRISNLRRTRLTALCSDDDNTIAGTCTIDSCRAGILKYLYRLDVVRVDRTKDVVGTTSIIIASRYCAIGYRANRESVYDDKRVVTCAYRCGTTNTEGCTRTRLRTNGAYLQTGCLACKGMAN